MKAITDSIIYCLGMAMLGLLMAIGLVTFQVMCCPVIAADPPKPPENLARELLPQVNNAISLYCSDHDEIVPAFSSQSLPRWWSEYGKGIELSPQILIYTEKPYVGKNIRDVDDN